MGSLMGRLLAPAMRTTAADKSSYKRKTNRRRSRLKEARIKQVFFPSINSKATRLEMSRAFKCHCAEQRQRTGSYPPLLKGWHRNNRFSPSVEPFKKPYSGIASAAYSEH